MQTKTWQVHILRLYCTVKNGKYVFKLLNILSGYLAADTFLKK